MIGDTKRKKIRYKAGRQREREKKCGWERI
jgi:hypothetical protein